MTSDISQLTAAELLENYRTRQLSPVEVTQDILDRSAAADAALHIFLAVDHTGALAAAKSAELEWSRRDSTTPPLCGVPISIKDTIEVDGMPTTYGSEAFKENNAPDSLVAARLRDAGAILFAKTNTPEFALVGATHNRLTDEGINPWDRTRTCGGSSGGSAAAVAACIGPISIGTDARGSIRQPAAYNGIVGFKPTFGVVPVVQRWRAAPLRSHVGPFARSIADIRTVMSVVAGSDDRDPMSTKLASPPQRNDWRRRTAALVIADESGSDDGQRVEAAEHAASLISATGWNVVTAILPIHPAETTTFDPTAFPYAPDHLAAVEALVQDFMKRSGHLLSDYARPVYERGATVSGLTYRQRLLEDTAFRARIQRWFEPYDLVITPACGAAPFLKQSSSESDFRFLKPFNTGHNPAVVIPWKLTNDGLPLGVQLVGRLGDDVSLLDTAELLMGVHPWHAKPPAQQHDQTGDDT